MTPVMEREEIKQPIGSPVGVYFAGDPQYFTEKLLKIIKSKKEEELTNSKNLSIQGYLQGSNFFNNSFILGKS